MHSEGATGRIHAQKILLTLTRARHAEIDTALVVRLGRSRQVEVRERNLLRMLRREVPQNLAYDGVILHFLLVLIAENQHRGWHRFHGILLAGLRRRRVRIHILIALLAHPRRHQSRQTPICREARFPDDAGVFDRAWSARGRGVAAGDGAV